MSVKLSAAGPCLLALGVMALAIGLRWLLDPWLDDRLALLTACAAIVVAVLLWGWLPALLAALAGFLAADYLFISPRGSLGFGNAAMLADLFGYVLSAGLIIAFGEVLRAGRSAARALRESEDRFRLMADAAPVMIWISGIDKACHWFNRQWLEFTGRTLEEETGDGWMEIVHPDDRERCRQIHDAGFDECEPFFMEYRMRRHDGQYRWLLDHGEPLYGADKSFIGYIGSCIDITDRKQAEAAQRQVFAVAESSDEFIGMCDLGMRPLYINQAGLSMVGLDDGMESLDLPLVTDFFFPEDRAYMLDEFFPRVLREGQAEIEVRLRHFRTGEPVWVIYSVVMLIDENGSPSGFGTVSRDITERRKAEQALRQADRRKDEFLATLAHELRNPLAPIRNSLEVMKRAEDDVAVLRQSRETIERQLAHMVRLVDDLLDVSRITRDKIDLRKSPVELRAVIQQALETVRPLIESGDHRIEWQLPPAPVWLNADAVRLAQVFSNLFNNACKFMDVGGRISLHAELHGREVLIRVKDNGTGIDPGKLEEIFEMFAQADRTLERSPAGLGIGLTLVKRLVELHGGHIRACSEGIGKGSEFVLTLPVVEAPAEPLPVRGRVEKAPPLRRILVVDDNGDSAQTLALLLRLNGHETQLAYDGQAAVAAAECFRPDLILLDIGLPGMNGLEACRRIRGKPWGKSMVIVALTGWGQEADRRRSQDAGFDQHLVKPVDYAALTRLLASLPPLRQESPRIRNR